MMPKPFYQTYKGQAYQGDALELLKCVEPSSINLIVTSPPFALRLKKEYGNEDANNYVEWFKQFIAPLYNALSDDGSLVIDIGGSWNAGSPTRSIYQFELLIELCKTFYLAQDFYWYNPSRLPTPAEWVTVRRVRVKDAIDYVWWLSKTEHPKANNRNVLRPYSKSMLALLKNGYKAKMRPSGHDISTKFNRNNGGAIAPNLFDFDMEVLDGEEDDIQRLRRQHKKEMEALIRSQETEMLELQASMGTEEGEVSNLLTISNTDSNDHYLSKCREKGIKPHPARFPAALPEFFINFLTDVDDMVLDPFAGSNMTGYVAEQRNRRWMSFELDANYLEGSRLRFE